MSALIEFEEVCKYYQMGDTTVKAADHITMKIDKGEFVAIVGQSGSGKSTCMNIIGCLDVPTHGVYRLNGRDVGKMSRNELAAVRNEMLGFIFQQYNLLPKLSLIENVGVPLVYAGVPRGERRRRAAADSPKRADHPRLPRRAGDDDDAPEHEGAQRRQALGDFPGAAQRVWRASQLDQHGLAEHLHDVLPRDGQEFDPLPGAYRPEEALL